MFISDIWELPEYDEAIPPEDYDGYTQMIEESNNKFAFQLGKLIIEKEFNLESIYKGIKDQYGNYAKKNNIAAFNCDRLFYNPKI
ncbi:hypothetical protein [Flavobacterium aciduliphilum]|uniref:Uncharacterized protein n=1 Tax=Flavobacterium aciduliphilum TaxID=1101402 RepID=A0A328YNU1_9FLAO|nr:hypothetical protein [Flavobacterium aciduliphilum]RAR73812.1 hypothetical protein CLV55_103131 [Flavobacterium aciduliphilum]